MRFLLPVCGLFAIALAAATTHAEDSRMKHITTIEGISEFELDNGLKILLFPDPSSSKVTVNLTVFVGSRHEGYGEAGMAHLLEHMLFKGTPTHPSIPKELSSRGADFNGTTWLDRTNYYETLPASNENLEFAIKLEADRMVNSYVKGEDLKSEMTVVRNEFERGENNPPSVLFQKMMAAAYEWHNYGHATIGNRADIERVPIENLKEFYQKYYQPDNAMLVVAGKFEPEDALKYAEKYFGAIPKPERELPNTYTEEPAQDGERFITLRRVGEVSVAGVIYHIPAGAHPDFAAVDVLESVLTAEPSGRLYKSLVETRKAASIYGGVFALHDPGVLRLLVEVNDGVDPQSVLDTTFETIQDVMDKGVTDEEVNRAKQSLLKQRELSAAKSSSIAIELSEWAAQGDWRLYFLYRDRVEKVTPEDVHRVAKAYLRENNRTTGLFIPTKESDRVSIPQVANLGEMIGDYKGREDVALGEAFDVSPENIEERTQRITLPGGIEAALLPKKTRGKMVTLRLTLRYGNLQTLGAWTKEAEFLPPMMLRGTENYTRQQIKDALDQQVASLSASGAVGSATFRIECKRDNLPAVLEILSEVLRKPVFPEVELETLKNAEVASMDQKSNDPTALAQKRIGQVLHPFEKGDPRYVPDFEEEMALVKGITPDRLKELYNTFLNGRHGELTVVGDFEPSEVLTTMTEMVSGWDSKVPYEEIKKPGDIKIAGTREVIETPDKANATYFAATAFAMSDTDPQYAAFLLGDWILGGGSLSSRLGDRVRQQDGLSYGVGSGFRADADNERAVFYLYAISNPENTDKVVVAIREEVDRILKDGVTPEELERAKQGFLQEQIVNRSSDSQLAATLESTSQHDRTMKHYADLEAKVAAVTPEEVRKALQAHIDFKRIHIVTAGDFEALKKKSE